MNAIVGIVSPSEQWRELGKWFRIILRIIVFERPGAVIGPVAALFRVDLRCTGISA